MATKRSPPASSSLSSCLSQSAFHQENSLGDGAAIGSLISGESAFFTEFVFSNSSAVDNIRVRANFLIVLLENGKAAVYFYSTFYKYHTQFCCVCMMTRVCCDIFQEDGMKFLKVEYYLG
uniref:Uncharacterized protein n=1 Tax=Corethron hystrix TaxID=216773 RepID=A0A7S1BWD2_9STRA